MSNLQAIQNKRRGILVSVLSCCTIMFGHTRIDGHHICMNSSGMCLIIHSIAQTSRPLISIFSNTSKNSYPVSISVFRIHRGRDECHTVVLIPGIRNLVPLHGIYLNSEGEYVKNSSTLAVSVPINISLNWVFFL